MDSAIVINKRKLYQKHLAMTFIHENFKLEGYIQANFFYGKKKSKIYLTNEKILMTVATNPRHDNTITHLHFF